MSGTQQTAQALGGAQGGGAVERLKAVGASIQQVLAMFKNMPQADQQKIAQAEAMIQQAAQLLVAAVRGGGGAPGG